MIRTNRASVLRLIRLVISYAAERWANVTRFDFRQKNVWQKNPVRNLFAAHVFAEFELPEPL